MILPDFLLNHPNGEIRLTGHRIGLYTIVRDYQEGMSMEQMAEEYPSLDLEHIHKVIGFYLANRVDVDTYVEEYRKELERQEATMPRLGPSFEELKSRWLAQGRGPLP